MPNGGQMATVDEAIRLDEIGFPKLRSKLVSDTFSAIVGSMIHQQEPYTDPDQKVAMANEDFETEAVSTEDIDRDLRRIQRIHSQADWRGE